MTDNETAITKRNAQENDRILRCEEVFFFPNNITARSI